MIRKMNRPRFMLTASTATRSLRSAFPASRVVNLLKTLPASVAGAGLGVVFPLWSEGRKAIFFTDNPPPFPPAQLSHSLLFISLPSCKCSSLNNVLATEV